MRRKGERKNGRKMWKILIILIDAAECHERERGREVIASSRKRLPVFF